MHKMYEVMLGRYPLLYAVDGRVALEHLTNHPDIDLVLLDLNTPNMSGLEFLEEIGGREQAARLRIIIVSSEGNDADVARGLELGARDVIKKPFSAQELLDKIANLA